MISTILFDVDGTLVDSVDFHAHAWVEAFAHAGHPVPFPDIRAQIGKGGDHILPLFLSPDEVKRLGKDLSAWREKRFMDAYLPRVRPFPMVKELFARLHEDGKKIALASSAKGELLSALKKLLDVDAYLAAATSSEDARRSKPDPDIFDAALDRLGRPPIEEVMVIGDSPHDAVAAGKLGLQTLGVLCGGFDERVLREAGCMDIYRDPAHLLAAYDASPLSDAVGVRSSGSARS